MQTQEVNGTVDRTAGFNLRHHGSNNANPRSQRIRALYPGLSSALPALSLKLGVSPDGERSGTADMLPLS